VALFFRLGCCQYFLETDPKHSANQHPLCIGISPRVKSYQQTVTSETIGVGTRQSFFAKIWQRLTKALAASRD
jgi:hypothetical protein